MKFTNKNPILTSFLLCISFLMGETVVDGGGIRFTSPQSEWIPHRKISEAQSSWEFGLSGDSNLSKNMDGGIYCKMDKFKIENCFDDHYSSMTECELNACYYFGMYTRKKTGIGFPERGLLKDFELGDKADTTMINASTIHGFESPRIHSRQTKSKMQRYQNASIIHRSGFPTKRSRQPKGEMVMYRNRSRSFVFSYLGFFLFVGLMICGLFLLPARDVQIQNTTNQQIGNGISSPDSVRTSCKFYAYGAMSSAIAIIIFLIHFCIRRWHTTQY